MFVLHHFESQLVKLLFKSNTKKTTNPLRCSVVYEHNKVYYNIPAVGGVCVYIYVWIYYNIPLVVRGLH